MATFTAQCYWSGPSGAEDGLGWKVQTPGSCPWGAHPAPAPPTSVPARCLRGWTSLWAVSCLASQAHCTQREAPSLRCRNAPLPSPTAPRPPACWLLLPEQGRCPSGARVPVGSVAGEGDDGLDVCLLATCSPRPPTPQPPCFLQGCALHCTTEHLCKPRRWSVTRRRPSLCPWFQPRALTTSYGWSHSALVV